MGSWSVYCGISNIAITAGNKCVLLPLKKKDGYDSYLPYLPATLPIFGEYDDYGGMENIEKNSNTKLIEDHFGISIEEFVQIFVDWKTYERKEVDPIMKKMKNPEEVNEWEFMFIDRQVYDYMISNVEENERGHLDLGTPEMLKYLGFKYIEEDKDNKTYDPKRFYKKYRHGETIFWSDGTTLLSGKGKGDYIYYITDRYGYGKKNTNALENYIKIPKTKMWLANVAKWQLLKIIPKKAIQKQLSWILGKSVHSVDMEEMFELMAKIKNEVFIPKPKIPKLLVDKYINEIEIFGKGLSDLITLRTNLYPMSQIFAPFVLYITPQCGEYREHQKILEKFAEINKSYLRED